MGKSSIIREFVITKNVAGIDYIRFDTLDYRKQKYFNELEGIDQSKIKMIPVECGTCPPVKYVEREYFYKRMLDYHA